MVWKEVNMFTGTFIFLGGLHRSGTSLLHEILRGHPAISGFSGTGVPQDEGQLLQSVYEPARTYGGPGKFVFDSRSYMDETHPLATPENAQRLLDQWGRYLNLNSQFLIEKSPPNIIHTRFLQKLFPQSYFVIILRHPVAVALATRKWSKTNPLSLIEHSLRAMEIFLRDMPHLERVFVLRYEEFVREPQRYVDEIFEFIQLPTLAVTHQVRSDVNAGYFTRWIRERDGIGIPLFRDMPSMFEKRANVFGYSLDQLDELLPVAFLGPHRRSDSPASG